MAFESQVLYVYSNTSQKCHKLTATVLIFNSQLKRSNYRQRNRETICSSHLEEKASQTRTVEELLLPPPNEAPLLFVEGTFP